MLTERRTDIMKLIVTFLNFADAPKNQHLFREAKPSYAAPQLAIMLTHGVLMRMNNEVGSRKVTVATLTVIDKKLSAYIIIRVVSCP